jgi:hypothetical protein
MALSSGTKTRGIRYLTGKLALKDKLAFTKMHLLKIKMTLTAEFPLTGKLH